MSWTAVARKDFRDAVRVKWFWALTALFVVFAGGAAYLYGEVDLFSGGQAATATGLIGFLSGASGTLVPIIALLVGYKAIVGERDSGSLKLLLSLPHTRGEVVLGKLLGRTAVVSLAILVGYLVAVVIGLVTFSEFAVGDFLLFTLLTILLGLAYISIAIGLSSAVSSGSRAGAIAIGFWLVFEFLWGLVGILLVWAVNGFSLRGLFQGGGPEWYQLFLRLSPTNAYSAVVGTLLPGSGGGGIGGAGGQGAQPFFLQDWFGLVILVVWVAVPVGLGYLRFRDTDL